MAILFPIFDTLYNQCILNPDDYIINGDMRLTISTLNDEHIKVISLLILHFSVCDNINNGYNFEKAILINKPIQRSYKRNNLIIDLPYKGVTTENGKGILYDIDNYPPLLEKIIAAYITNIIM